MKRLFSSPAILITAFFFLSIPAASIGQEAIELDVDVAAICTSVVERQPVGTGISFPASVGELFCFTKILGAQTPTQITHVWYFGLTERARVNLAVNSAVWRTYSSKKIQPHEIGAWHVNVLDATGTVLKVIQFTTTAEQEEALESAQPLEPVLEEEQEEASESPQPHNPVLESEQEEAPESSQPHEPVLEEEPETE